jgi:N-acetylglutamate synthase
MFERTIEELTLNAWPALSSVVYDGWVLRFADGYTRRANSVNPLYASSLPLDEKIAQCEATYAARNQATVFKLTDASPPAGLDDVLADAGYQAEATTSVQVADLASQALAWDPAVSLAPAVSDEWLDDLFHLVVVPERYRPSERRMLQSVVPAQAFATLREDGQALAVGLAVAERGYVGLYSIVTAGHARNRRLGRRLVGHLLAWGRERGAHTGYLAVMVDNAPALRLYERFGFREAYRYWYRTKGLTHASA